MKKVWACLLTVVLLLAMLTACGNGATKPDVAPQTTTTATQAAFEKPAGYVSVVMVTINPQFKLYLDANGDVLAVEPVNADAKQVAEKMTVKTGTIATVVNSLITVANNDGFVKQDITVNIEITEVRSEAVNTATVLKTLKSTVEAEMQELDVQADVKTSVVEDALVATTVSKIVTTEASAVKTETTVRTAVKTSEKTTEKPTVKTTVATTTKVPTTVPNYTAVTLKNGYWEAKYLEKETLQIVSLTLVGELSAGLGLGDPLSSLPEEVREDMKPDCIIFQGEYYYVGRGDGDSLESIVENGISVTIKDLSGNTLTLKRISETELEVVTATPGFAVFESLPKGLVFTYHTPEA